MNVDAKKHLEMESLPNWDDLIRVSLNKIEPDVRQQIETLKTRDSKRIMTFGRKVVTQFFKDPAIRKFAEIEWPDLVEFLAAQMSENRSIRSLSEKGYANPQLNPHVSSSSFVINRNFSQLPCTRLTIQKRCEKARQYCSLHDPILVLGDDDMLSLGLAACGFTNIHVLDIDPKVLEVIRKEAREQNIKLNTHLQDISQPLSADLPRNFRMVFFDPFYSLEGLGLFLRAAETLTQESSKSVYFLSIHLLSLMRSGLEQLAPILDQHQLETLEVLPNFNSYPVPSSLKLLVKIVNKVIIRDPVMRLEGSAFNFFTSDALILTHKN